MKSKLVAAFLKWEAQRAKLEHEKEEMLQYRRGIHRGKQKDLSLTEVDRIVDDLYTKIRAQDHALRELCIDFTSDFDKTYITQKYGKELERRVQGIFQKELSDTLCAMNHQSQSKNTKKIKTLLEQGCAAFISNHAATPAMWTMHTQTALQSILKQELIPSVLLKALRFHTDLYSQINQYVWEILSELHLKMVRSYTIRDLKADERINGDIRKALKKAEKSFDYTVQFAQTILLDYIPDDYAKLYPAARTTERHFILHIGPTNSGKTYAARQALKHTQDGIYLAPLRLLAFEQFEEMNKDGIYCSLKTGQQTIQVPGSRVQSSTIQMLDERHHYDVVVIDEGQMIQDPMRGGHWTKAILGAWSRVIHICLAPEAQDIVIRMICQCRDTYEIVRHQRFNELVPDKASNVHFPRQVEDGDAYIVFSRASAHACVAELQRNGIDPSIIYGALPYDVRQNEARRFRDGQTNVVVATDAIGMGLNLPIRRVIFLETEKYDGISRRNLHATEYKQIAGRAGRYGQYEQGLFVSPHQMNRVEIAIRDSIPQIQAAHLLFPDILLGIDAPLSSILRMWDAAPVNEGYLKGDVSQQIYLAEQLESRTNDKKLLYNLASMPFDGHRTSLLKLWRALARDCIHHEQVRIDAFIPDIKALVEKPELEKLEEAYRQYDLLYYFAERFDKTQMQLLIDERKVVSKLMMQFLAKTKFPPKSCSICNVPLAWNSPLKLCNKCAGKG